MGGNNNEIHRRQFLDELWHDLAGLKYAPKKAEPINLEELKESEWSPEFEKLMRNRLIMGSIRYGRMSHNGVPVAGKPKYDRINSIRRRLNDFEESGNMEHLVDISNLCLLMFEEKSHPNSHFESIDDGEHDNIIS